MRIDHKEIFDSYNNMIPTLTEISNAIREMLEDIVREKKHIDRVICRCKSLDSFMTKANKKDENGTYKYEVPLKEIQDKIGARIVVYYKSDVEPVRDIVMNYFKRIEEKMLVPDDPSKFGYEGFHIICKIPNTIYQLKSNPLIGDFFELQIKTLYQHAWSQSNHGLGYKPDDKLNEQETRLLAFIAAQSWGADKGLLELTEEKRHAQ